MQIVNYQDYKYKQVCPVCQVLCLSLSLSPKCFEAPGG